MTTTMMMMMMMVVMIVIMRKEFIKAVLIEHIERMRQYTLHGSVSCGHKSSLRADVLLGTSQLGFQVPYLVFVVFFLGLISLCTGSTSSSRSTSSNRSISSSRSTGMMMID